MNRYCPFCKGEMEHGSTTFTADLEFGVVVVRQVPARMPSSAARTGLKMI